MTEPQQSSRAVRAAVASVAVLAAAVLFHLVLGAPASAGTSLDSCLAQPTTTPTGTYANGYSAASSNRTYDFRNARFTQQNLNQYVVRSDGASNVCVLNAAVEGLNDPSASWQYLKNNYNGTSFYAGGSASYWNVRADDIAVDMFRLKPGTSYTIQQAYGTYIRDDCVAFGNTDLEIRDSLFECYNGLSWRSMGGETAADAFNLTIERSLFYIQPQPVSAGNCSKNVINGKGNGNFWKMDAFTGTPEKFHLTDVVIRIDQYNRDCNTSWADATYSNVTLVWTGGGDYWAHIGQPAPPGITTTSDVSVWDTAKAGWLADHACPTDHVGLCRLVGAPADPPPSPSPSPTASPDPSPTDSPQPDPSPTDATDTSPPTVSLTSDAASVRSGTPVTVTADARDDVGVTAVELYQDGALLDTRTAAPYAWTWDTTGLAEGDYSLQAKAFDAAGNSTTSNPVTVTVDDTAPTISATVSPLSVVSGTAVSVVADATDAVGVAAVDFAVDGVVQVRHTAPPYSWTWSTTGLPAGTYAVTTTAYDAAGNAATSPAVDVQVAAADRTAPVVAVAASPTSVKKGGTVSLSATASDNVGVTKVRFFRGTTLLGTDTTAPYTYSWSTSGLSAGTYKITAKANDLAGNVGTSAAVTVTIDATAPTVSVTATPTTVQQGDTVSLAATASDKVGVAGVDFYDGTTLLGTVTASPYAYAWSTSGASIGPHAITAKAYDAAGNTRTSTSVTVTVTS